jgi:hypothetical protein
VHTTLGEFMRALAGLGGSGVAPEAQGWKDTIYTAAGAQRVLHKPTLRYQVLWTDSTQKASGAVRAFEAASEAAASVRPYRAAYNFYSA